MAFPKYPEIKVWSQNNEEYFATTIRKLHEGMWYLQAVFLAYKLDPNNIQASSILAWQAFQRELYKAVILGRVDPNIIRRGLVGEEPLYTIDPDQSTEEERVIKTYIPYGIGA